jgi:hypothetical protein
VVAQRTCGDTQKSSLPAEDLKRNRQLSKVIGFEPTLKCDNPGPGKSTSNSHDAFQEVTLVCEINLGTQPAQHPALKPDEARPNLVRGETRFESSLREPQDFEHGQYLFVSSIGDSTCMIDSVVVELPVDEEDLSRRHQKLTVCKDVLEKQAFGELEVDPLE